MSQEIPDHVSLSPDSPHFFQMWKKVGVKINGQVVFTVLEFCKSERWAVLGIKDGRTGVFKRERGKIIGIKHNDVSVETYWRD
jgi:hypothetical protein